MCAIVLALTAVCSFTDERMAREAGGSIHVDFWGRVEEQDKRLRGAMDSFDAAENEMWVEYEIRDWATKRRWRNARACRYIFCLPIDIVIGLAASRVFAYI